MKVVPTLSLRPQEGLKFLTETEAQWQPRSGLVTHVWWHKSLFHFQLGELEQAVTVFDDHILPSCKKEPSSFPLSDATALLLRLQMESKHAALGAELAERWREVANLYSNIVDDTATQFLFYDMHALLGCLFGNDT